MIEITQSDIARTAEKSVPEDEVIENREATEELAEKLLKRVVRLFEDEETGESRVTNELKSEDSVSVVIECLNSWHEYQNSYQRGKALSAFIVAVNTLTKNDETYISVLKSVLMMMTEYAPDTVSQLLELVPEYSTSAILVNGKMTARLEVVKSASFDEVKDLALQDEKVVKAIGNGQIVRASGKVGKDRKVINFIVKDSE